MKAQASLLQQQSVSATESQAVDNAAATSARPPGLCARLIARVRSWFEIPCGYEDENGFHYGKQPPPRWLTESAAQRVFTDRADEAMTHHLVLPKLTTDIPDQCEDRAAPVTKD